jgi:transcriptional regulator with XRE-family HTH domain
VSKSDRKKIAVPAIAEYMEEHSLSQQGFADKVGVSQGLVWQWLNGETAVTPEKAKEIEDATGIPRLKLLYPEERAA